MSEFTSVDAALFSFKKRERRFVLTRIAIVYIVLSLLAFASAIALAWPLLKPLLGWYFSVLGAATNGGEPPAPPIPTVLALSPYWGLWTLVSVALYAMFEAACLRWMVRGEASPLGLGINADVLRILLTYLCWFGAFVLFCVGASVLVAGVFMLAKVDNAARFLGILLMGLVPLGLFFSLVFCSVRLSPAAALSVAQQKFVFPSAFGATRGVFWPMLGAFVLLIVGYVAISWAVSSLSQIALTAASGELLQAISANPEAMGQALLHFYSSPVVAISSIAYVVVANVMAMMFYIAWFGVNARVAADKVAAPA